MAIEKILNTRVINKHDSLTNWNSSSLKLKDGEIALAYVETTKPDGHGGSYTIPTYLMKVGVEGKTFSELEWLAAPASDVYAWAKLENPTIDQLPGNLKTAITNLQSAVGDGGSVAESIANAINALDSDSTGTGTIVKSVVQTDGKVSVEMGTLSADEIPTLTVSKLSDFDTAVATKVEAYGYETVANVNAYKEEVAEALKGKQAAGDYAAEVHTHVKEDITDFAHTHTASEVTDFATEVAKVKVENATKADEATKATQDGNGDVIADTYAKKATTLAGYGIGDAYTKDEVDDAVEGAINTFVSAYITSDGDAIDKLQEIASWIDSDKDGAADIIADVEANATGITNLGTRMDAAEDAIEAIDNHSHTNKNVIDGITADKVSAWDNAEDNAKTYAEGLNTAMNGRVEALEAIDHSHTFVESELNKIADGDVAKWNAAEQNAKDYADDEIEALVNEGQVKTNTDAIASINDKTNGILAQAKAYADGLNHEDTKYTAAADGGLKLDENNAFAIDDSITFIFDCGDSGVNA